MLESMQKVVCSYVHRELENFVLQFHTGETTKLKD